MFDEIAADVEKISRAAAGLATRFERTEDRVLLR